MTDNRRHAPTGQQRKRACKPTGRPRAGLGLDRRGSTIVEFALVAPLFFFMLFGVLELGLLLIGNSCLGAATLTLARQVRVGQIVLPGATAAGGGSQMSLAGFKAALCAKIPVLDNKTCLKQIQVDVRTQTGFQGQTMPNPVTGSNFNANGLCYYSGGPGDIVSVRAYLLWPIMTPVMLNALVTTTSLTTGSGSTTGSYLTLTAVEAFKNEPNATATNTGSGC